MSAGSFSASENTPTQRKRRVPPANGRVWVPGQSGNPGGRPKQVAEVVELARQNSQMAVRRLAQIATANKTPAVAAVMACNSILDRAWGKPIQPNIHAISTHKAAPIDLDALTDEQRDTLADILLLTNDQVEDGPVIDAEPEAE